MKNIENVSSRFAAINRNKSLENHLTNRLIKSDLKKV